jgi:hypothetical protein
MSGASQKEQLKTAMFESLVAPLRGHGFTLRASRDQFVRRHDDVTDIFQLTCLDGKPGLRVQPGVAVRFDLVEEIFHRTSGFEVKHQKDTPTIGSKVGNILSGSNRTCEFQIESRAHLQRATEGVLSVFLEFALPYFEKYSSLQAVDAELNTRPTERTPNRIAPWLRCATGVIVAKLTGRTDYDELVRVYTDVMKHSDRGFYLARFQALVESLKSLR